MRNTIRIVGGLALLLAGYSELWAQDTASARDTLERRTRAGDRLTIDALDGTTVRGRLVSTTPDTLVVDSGAGDVTIAFGDIDRVRRRRNGVVLGAIIGLGAGVALGIPVRMLIEIEGGDATRAQLTLAAFGTAMGVAADAVLSLNRTIYRRQRTSIAFAPQPGGVALGVTTRW